MEQLGNSTFLVNIHTIHNMSLIQETVKTVYAGPKPYFGSNQKSHHTVAAARLWVSGPKKHMEANKKCKATREQNKSTQCAQAAEEANVSSKTQHSGDGGSDVEAVTSVNVARCLFHGFLCLSHE